MLLRHLKFLLQLGGESGRLQSGNQGHQQATRQSVHKGVKVSEEVAS